MPRSDSSRLYPSSLVLPNAFPGHPHRWLQHGVTPWKQLTHNYTLNSSTIPQLTAYTPLFENGEKSNSFTTFWKDRLWKNWYWYCCCLYVEAKIINLYAHNCPTVANHFSDPKWSACFQWKITSEWKWLSTKLSIQIQNKQHNEVLETLPGLCHREHHPFSAADIFRISQYQTQAVILSHFTTVSIYHF